MNLIDLLHLTLSLHASDLHLAAEQTPMFRIDGQLTAKEDITKISTNKLEKLFIAIMKEEQIKQFYAKKEIDFSLTIANFAVFRVHLFYNRSGVAGVFRPIVKQPPSFDALFLPPIFKKILYSSGGLLLVTGSTGTGKSTTLAAMVDYINTNMAKHIITLEDPIEFIHQSKKSLINQRQIYADTLTFDAALHAALRQDPDVILIGEMRDLNTIRLALRAAETGHLVISTLHTSSAPRAINRIVDVFKSSEKNFIRTMLAESLQAIIYQTLLKKIAGGRIAAFEIMLGTVAIKNLIRENKIAQMLTTMQTNNALGMCSLEQGIRKLIEKKIIEENQMPFMIDTY